MNTPTIKRYERDEQRRLQAAVLFEEGLSVTETARRLHVSRQSVSGWYQIWKENGTEGLKGKKPGPACRLSEEQQQLVAQELLKGPEAHGYNTPLWTLPRITALIAKVTGVSYHPGHVWYMMDDLGWSCQKPEQVAKERNDAEIERFVSEEWPRIKKGAMKRGAKIAFLDESGFSLKPSVRRTWAPRGQTPKLVHRFRWKRLNVIGTLICDAEGSHLEPHRVFLVGDQRQTAGQRAS